MIPTLSCSKPTSSSLQPVACVVKPLDRVTFTPHEPSALTPIIRGTVFNTLDTSSGNWRVRIVREGEAFPFGVSANVYTNLGTFEIHGVLDASVQPAIA
ncbi:hypothetical protein H8F21_13265 [Pseudomonas sp. P66]|uniref:Uncharacterized protein n=1 Tax=Pseudomonas arcuscaelestis TaxID=2710591 RepID=A0ABS2BY35_9PSED|nr:hypothetical protein [Pseudomonas arcuscaelestis]